MTDGPFFCTLCCCSAAANMIMMHHDAAARVLIAAAVRHMNMAQSRKFAACGHTRGPGARIRGEYRGTRPPAAWMDKPGFLKWETWLFCIFIGTRFVTPYLCTMNTLVTCS